MIKGPTTEPALGDWLERYRSHLLDREYMSGIERNEIRIKATAEVFTPISMVRKMIAKIGKDNVCDPKKRIIDTTCGDGQFLAYILYCRLEAKVSLVAALETLFGIEKELDNFLLCQERLRCGHNDLDDLVFKIVSKNIVRANSLTYHMRFDGSPSDLSPIQNAFKL